MSGSLLGRQLEVEVVEAVVAQQLEHEGRAASELALTCSVVTVDVRVVLGEAAHPGEAVHDAGLLVAVDRAELGQPQRQLAVAGPRDRKIRLCIGQFIGLR